MMPIARARGARARELYERSFAADVVAGAWDDLLGGLLTAR